MIRNESFSTDTHESFSTEKIRHELPADTKSSRPQTSRNPAVRREKPPDRLLAPSASAPGAAGVCAGWSTGRTSKSDQCSNSRKCSAVITAIPRLNLPSISEMPPPTCDERHASPSLHYRPNETPPAVCPSETIPQSSLCPTPTAHPSTH
jgi:hypothetical protein